MSVATTGRPDSIASTIDRGIPSRCEGSVKMSAARSSAGHVAAIAEKPHALLQDRIALYLLDLGVDRLRHGRS